MSIYVDKAVAYVDVCDKMVWMLWQDNKSLQDIILQYNLSYRLVKSKLRNRLIALCFTKLFEQQIT